MYYIGSQSDFQSPEFDRLLRHFGFQKNPEMRPKAGLFWRPESGRQIAAGIRPKKTRLGFKKPFPEIVFQVSLWASKRSLGQHIRFGRALGNALFASAGNLVKFIFLRLQSESSVQQVLGIGRCFQLVEQIGC